MEDDVLHKLSELRTDIAELFGGGTTLALPLHVTLVRWTGTAEMALGALGRFDRAALAISVPLNGPEIASGGDVVWYQVKSEPLEQLRMSLATEIRQNGGTVDGSRSLLHVTLAYRDYSSSEIEKIQAYAAKMSPSQLSLRGDRLEVCVRDRNGIWTLAEDTRQQI